MTRHLLNLNAISRIMGHAVPLRKTGSLSNSRRHVSMRGMLGYVSAHNAGRPTTQLRLHEFPSRPNRILHGSATNGASYSSADANVYRERAAYHEHDEQH